MGENHVRESAIDIAWDKSDTEALKLLLRNGLDPNTVREYHKSGSIVRQPLTARALRQNDLELVGELLSRGADPNAVEQTRYSYDPNDPDGDDWPLLSMAIDLGNDAAVKLLLEYGAHPNSVHRWQLGDPWDQEPVLILAVRRKNVGIVRTLLEHGGDANVIGESGIWPYDCEFYFGMKVAIEVGDLSIARLLLEHGANPNFPSWVNGREVSRDALVESNILKLEASENLGSGMLSFACESNRAEIAELLVKFGANITPQCIVSASSEKNFVLAEYLLMCWAREQETQSTVEDMMVASAAGGCMECIRSCLGLGAPVNGMDSRGATALSTACEAGHLEAINFLLAEGADINLKDSSGKTPLLMACVHNQLDAAQLLLAKGADVTLKDSAGRGPLIEACSKNNLDLAKALLQSGADLEEQDERGITPLIVVCKNHENQLQSSELVACLVDYGADVNRPDKTGTTPLMHSAQASAPRETLVTLIEAGANVNARNGAGKTALMLGCEWPGSTGREGAYDRIEILLKAGADVSITDNRGRTAMQFVISHGCSGNLVVLNNILTAVRDGLSSDRSDLLGIIQNRRNRYGETEKWISALGIREVLYEVPTRESMRMIREFESLVRDAGKGRLLRDRIEVRNPHSWIGSVSLDWSGLSKVLRHLREYPEAVEFLEWAKKKLRPQMERVS